jgi:hypothetical protein
MGDVNQLYCTDMILSTILHVLLPQNPQDVVFELIISTVKFVFRSYERHVVLHAGQPLGGSESSELHSEYSFHSKVTHQHRP